MMTLIEEAFADILNWEEPRNHILTAYTYFSSRVYALEEVTLSAALRHQFTIPSLRKRYRKS